MRTPCCQEELVLLPLLLLTMVAVASTLLLGVGAAARRLLLRGGSCGAAAVLLGCALAAHCCLAACAIRRKHVHVAFAGSMGVHEGLCRTGSIGKNGDHHHTPKQGTHPRNGARSARVPACLQQLWPINELAANRGTAANCIRGARCGPAAAPSHQSLLVEHFEAVAAAIRVAAAAMQ